MISPAVREPCIGLYKFEQHVVKMSRHSFNFCIDEHPHVRHVELSCFEDPESGEWSMKYKSRYSDTTKKGTFQCLDNSNECNHRVVKSRHHETESTHINHDN